MAVVSYKCPHCGGELVFDPSSQTYRCDYCISNFTQEDIDKIQEVKSSQQELGVYNCPSCGAQIVADKTTAATFCYYCHTPVVLSDKVANEFAPERIIPFQIDEKEAKDHFMAFVRSKKFVPKAFFNRKQLKFFKGVYFPYWLFDGQITASANGEANRVRVWTTGRTEYTEVKVYYFDREGTIDFQDIEKCALSSANKLLVEGVMPFDMSQAVPFEMAYLSGFLGESRDIEHEFYKEEVDKQFQDYTHGLFRDLVTGYSSITSQETIIRNKDVTPEYVLFPVWTLTYNGKDGKTYYFSMNGQTGKVFGELPIDHHKVTKICASIAGIVFGIMMAGGMFIW